MAKYIARVFIPMYLEVEAESKEAAQEVAQQWYKEQMRDWREPTVEVMPIYGIILPRKEHYARFARIIYETTTKRVFKNSKTAAIW